MRANLSGAVGEITTLPGNSQIAVSHGVFVPVSQRGRGIGKQAQQKRLQLMSTLGYDYALCTVDSENRAQVHILVTAGWKQLDMFRSSKSDHLVLLFGKAL